MGTIRSRLRDESHGEVESAQHRQRPAEFSSTFPGLELGQPGPPHTSTASKLDLRQSSIITGLPNCRPERPARLNRSQRDLPSSCVLSPYDNRHLL